MAIAENGGLLAPPPDFQDRIEESNIENKGSICKYTNAFISNSETDSTGKAVDLIIGSDRAVITMQGALLGPRQCGILVVLENKTSVGLAQQSL
eukprot:SAG31_NODE_12483_length_938_cov_1.432658_2_plen_94_part_00